MLTDAQFTWTFILAAAALGVAVIAVGSHLMGRNLPQQPIEPIEVDDMPWITDERLTRLLTAIHDATNADRDFDQWRREIEEAGS